MSDEQKQVDRVPEYPPFGSITDGEWICARCGESRTGCALCAGEIRHVVKYRRGWGEER